MMIYRIINTKAKNQSQFEHIVFTKVAIPLTSLGVLGLSWAMFYISEHDEVPRI